MEKMLSVLKCSNCVCCHEELAMYPKSEESQISITCHNAKECCGVNGLEGHHKTCIYRTYNCRFEDCEWTGLSSSLLSHVQKAHMDSYIIERWETCLNRKEQPDKLILIHTLGSIFYCQQKVKNEILYWAIQYIGNHEAAAKYSFNITIGQGKRKLSISETCGNDLQTIEEIIESQNCTYIPLSFFETYLDESIENVYFAVSIINTVRCRLVKCEWRGLRNKFVAHVQQKHRDYYITTPWNKTIDSNDRTVVVVMEMYGSLFYAYMKNLYATVYWIVQHIGAPEEAKYFYYTVGGKRATCIDSLQGIDDSIEMGKCISRRFTEDMSFCLHIIKKINKNKCYLFKPLLCKEQVSKIIGK